MDGFYYIDEATKQQCGPFSLTDLQTKGIKPETMVWKSGMVDWVEARTVAELEFLFNPNAQPIDPTAQSTQYSQPVNNTYGGQQQYSQQQYNQPYNQQQYNQQSYNQQQYNNPNGYSSWNNNQGGINDVRPMPKNWLVESILVTILCCLPFGIAGIVSATKVESLYHAGDYEGAEQASRDAKKWTIVGFCSTFVLGVLYLIFVVGMGMMSAF